VARLEDEAARAAASRASIERARDDAVQSAVKAEADARRAQQQLFKCNATTDAAVATAAALRERVAHANDGVIASTKQQQRCVADVAAATTAAADERADAAAFKAEAASLRHENDRIRSLLSVGRLVFFRVCVCVVCVCVFSAFLL
jgi:hypothetical protein